MPQKLTEKTVAALQFKGKNHTIRDTQVTGLFVDVNKRSKSYKCQADLRSPCGARPVQTVRMTLGQWPTLPLAEARVKASFLLSQIKAGIDPRAKPKEEPASRRWTVAEAYEAYVSDLRTAGRAERTGRDMLDRLNRYVPSWKTLSIDAVDGLMTREAHQRITRDHGPRAANQTIAEFGSVFRLAARTFGKREMPDDPTEGVKRNEQKRRQVYIADLPRWWGKVAELSPLRRAMQRLGLLSGLRPGNLCAIRLDWINLDRPSICFPADVMKKREAFELPLSPAMFAVVNEAISLARITEPTSQWLFPTRTRSGAVVHTTVWRDKTLGNESGHLLRHSYSNLAAAAGIADSDIMRLMAHRVTGAQAIRNIYTSDSAQFERLLGLQTQVSEFILGRVGS